MKTLVKTIFAAAVALLAAVASGAQEKAAAPLYIDPVYNGSTDPMVCYNPVTGTYYMYYTSRRSNVPGIFNDWKGLPVFTSDDMNVWTKQEGRYLVDGQNGRKGEAVYVAELLLDENGRLYCDSEAGCIPSLLK